MDGSKNLNLRFACLYLSNGTSLWQDHRRIQQKKSYSLRQGEGKIVHEHDARVFIKPHYSNTRELELSVSCVCAHPILTNFVVECRRDVRELPSEFGLWILTIAIASRTSCETQLKFIRQSCGRSMFFC
ncbi:hypothetical protein KIN20_014208 [Parelaphostrongylus tenuis]|uniref:Uncharacterized protein n=1 Tax=Parelaphostrongylus tenuis TaxID=148309 RepID=A0AAD5MD98_PARTN|nr:hypothetical protein KIN20_014208 [Parelaphostrongylus tenuis]